MRNSRLGFWLIFSLLLSSCSQKQDAITFEAMDTFMSVKSFGKNAARANRLAKKEAQELDEVLSVTKKTSEVYKINSSDKAEITLSEACRDVLACSLEMAHKTGGAFNPFLLPITKEWGFTTKAFHVPAPQRIKSLLPLTDYRTVSLDGLVLRKQARTQVDFGGIGKGYAGDRMLEVLRQCGIKSAVLDLGGNVQVLGERQDGGDWRIGLKNPWDRDSSPVISIRVRDCAVITSGGYERYFTGDDGRRYIHIFDGKTGRPVENDLVSVTVICGDGRMGDALSTALFVMGKEKALEFWRENPGLSFELLLICDDFSLAYTGGLRDKISLLFDFKSVEICEK